MSAFKESGGIDYSADVLIGLQAKGAGKPSFNIDEAKRADPREIVTIPPSPALKSCKGRKKKRLPSAVFRRRQHFPAQNAAK